ncbi:DNA replication licensing factor MCM5 [Pancytospora epiphaga]|nr:DNA replication licensing factor MCM5 [Pancytospora epiphaga]
MEYQQNTVTSLDLIGQDRALNTERISSMFLTFIAEYKSTHKTYFHALSANITQNIMHLVVNLDHISNFSQLLASAVEKSPLIALEAFEAAICKKYALPYFQIQLTSSGNCTPIRNVNATIGNRIIKMRGIVVSLSTVITKPRELFLSCRNCLSTRTTRDIIPRSCEKAECPVDPYVIVPEKSTVLDIQYGKLQEDFEDIPTGETPRNISIVMEGDLVDMVVPGSQLCLTGIFVMSNTHNRHTSGVLRVLGIEGLGNKLKKTFTEEEEMFFRTISKNGIYEKIARSIAPSIYGSEDVKRALACMLFGGTRRLREDGIRLRGDINVLLLGDPGVAKSQLLKFIELVSPVGLYTSGKGSSAAGLTASVMKDRNNAWVLEGGALVLADNGVCCIDEFDKMRESDRVAIHEAMEQQTISIAKAGITTVLNTRTAILAAANPVFGRYDDYRTPTENIEFGTTILSRFDLIFIIKDSHSKRDMEVAEHVVGLHINNGHGGVENVDSQVASTQLDENASILSVSQLQSYIQYAKRINPTLSAEASARLSKFYVGIRQEVAEMKGTGAKSPVPVTVRQLESLIRISESLARMELLSVATASHVDEAIRLFQLSTMSAVSQGHMVEGMVRPSFYDELNEIVGKLKECMPVGLSRRFSDVVRNIGAKEGIVKSAVEYMVKQNKMLTKDYGRVLVRLP